MKLVDCKKIIILVMAAIFLAASFVGVVVSAPPKVESTTEDLGVSGLINERESALLKEFSTPQKKYQKVEVPFRIVIENNGNVVITPRGTIKIKDSAGSEVAIVTVNSARDAIRQGVTKVFNAAWSPDRSIGSGEYSANIEITYGTGGRLSGNLSFGLMFGLAAIIGNVAEAIGEVAARIAEAINQIKKTAKEALAPIVQNPVAEAVKRTANTAVPITVASSAIIPFLLNWSLVDVLARFLAQFLFLFGIRRRPPKLWGRVLDSESGQPISLAQVVLYNKDEKSVLQKQVTDEDGRFGFLAEPGLYRLGASKRNYHFPSTLRFDSYKGEVFEIGDEGVSNLNIYLDAELSGRFRRAKILSRLANYSNILRIPATIMGSVFAVMFYLGQPSTFNTEVLLLYCLFWLYEIYSRVHRTKSFGRVLDEISRQALDLSMVRVFNSTDGRLVATKLTNQRGVFQLLTNRGKFYLTITRPDYDQFKSRDLLFRKGSNIAGDFPLRTAVPEKIIGKK